MGFLSGLLTAVAIVATVVSGGTLGIVAGALMAASYAASKGWIGGSVGKFFNSSTGHYLTMAVGLASAATSIMSNMSAVTASSASATTASANAAAEGATAPGVAAIGQQADTALAADAADSASAAASPGNMAAVQTGMASNSAAPLVSGTSAQTMVPGGLTQYAGGLDQGGSLSGANGLSQAQIGASSASNAQVAKTLGIESNVSPEVSGSVAAPDAATSEANTGQQAGQGLANSQKAVNPLNSNLDVTSPSGGTTPQSPAQMAQAGPNFNGAASPGPSAGSQVGGMLSKAGDFINKNPGVATVAGNALSGMAQGASQQKIMQEQIAASQWGNMQWQDPSQVAKLQSAAAQPIGVPVGYLNRAAAVRNLMNNAGGGQTAPISGQPTAPAPTVKPVGM